MIAIKMRFLHYSAFWRSWSRILAFPGKAGISLPEGIGPYVEVNLSPLGGTSKICWENEVKPVIIRSHGTGLLKNDLTAANLPHDVLIQMDQMLGSDLTHFLLNEDLLPQIDWTKFRKQNNGGVSFWKCNVFNMGIPLG